MSLIDKILAKTAQQVELARIEALHKVTGAALSHVRGKSGKQAPKRGPAPASGPRRPSSAPGKKRIVKVQDGETFVIENDIDAMDVQVRDIDANDIDVSDVQIR